MPSSPVKTLRISTSPLSVQGTGGDKEQATTNTTMTKKKLGNTKQAGTKPVLGVDLFRCFLCQREGQSPPLRRCSQCEIAFYCSKECQRGHWKTHKAACVAAVAAKAQDAARQQLARACGRRARQR